MAKHTLHFSIEGEFITRTAREAFHENGDFKRAITLLKSSMLCDQLSERDIEQNCYDILNGRSRLCGIYPDGDYRYETIPGKEHACDMQDTIQALHDKITKLQKFADDLSKRYFFMCDNLSDYQVRQLQREYRDEYDENLFQSEETDIDKILSNFTTGLDCFSSSTQKEIRELIQNPSDTIAQFLEQTKHKEENEYGWLEPNGVFHVVDWGEHTAWATKYLQEHYPYAKHKDMYFMQTPAGDMCHIIAGDVLLYKLHWILIDNPTQGGGRHTCDPNSRMTKAQKEFLYDYYIKRNRHNEANALYD